MTRGLRHRRARLALLVLVALVTATAALAYFTSTGTGKGTAATATTQAVTLTAATPSAQLYPGGSSDVALTISNPNPITVRIGSLALDTSQGAGGFAVDGAHASCSAAALGFTTQVNGGSGWSVPPRVGSTNGSLAVDLTGALTMSSSAASACQGATFTVYLKAGS